MTPSFGLCDAGETLRLRKHANLVQQACTCCIPSSRSAYEVSGAVVDLFSLQTHSLLERTYRQQFHTKNVSYFVYVL